MSDENFIDALEEVVSQSKSSIAIGGAPLALLLAQLKHLVSVDGFWVSLLLTIAIVSLGIATFGAWYIANIAQSTLAVEKWRKNAEPPQKGREYFDFLKQLNPHAEVLYSEAGFVEVSRIWAKPTVFFLFLGYIALIVLLLTFVWSTP